MVGEASELPGLGFPMRGPLCARVRGVAALSLLRSSMKCENKPFLQGQLPGVLFPAMRLLC